MPLKKKYTFYMCMDCEIDFLVSVRSGRGKTFCPSCGETFRVEKKDSIWVERPFQYKRKWTEEEDSILIMGCNSGYSYQEIEMALEGRTRRAVRDRLQRLKGEGLV